MADSIKVLIDKYLQGKCNPKEEQLVIEWLEENDLEEYNDLSFSGNTRQRMENHWEEMTRNFPELLAADKRMSPQKKSKKRRLVAAVSIGILFLGALTAYWLVARKDTPQYVTGYGEVKSIVLPDGTGVTLNAKSSLTLHEDFNKKRRVVELTGQAFFQVKEEANIPFIVKTKKVNVKVLGTSFDVSAFENESDVSVALKEGKVLVQSAYFKKKYKKGILLQPGEEAVFKKKMAKVSLKKYNTKVKQAWQRQDLYFEDAGIKEVLHKIQRFYGVTIDTTNLRNRQWQLSGEYKNQTLKEVLESLSFNYDLKFKLEDKHVILYDKY